MKRGVTLATQQVSVKENAERVRDAIAGWNRDGFEGMRYFIHPDAVITPFEEWPDDSVYHGVEGFGKLAGQWTDQFENIVWDIERLEFLGGDEILLLVTHSGRILGTGVPMSAPARGGGRRLPARRPGCSHPVLPRLGEGSGVRGSRRRLDRD